MNNAILLHNTLSGKKESFVPQQAGVANLYCCGPTVYDYAHIGNFRSFLMGDLLSRMLIYAGYKVNKVQNITDVGHLTNDDFADADGEDKISKKAKAEGLDAFAVAEKFTDYFLEDEATLRIMPPAHRPKATDFIAEQIEMTQILLKKEYAYEINGSVYFRAEKFTDYGQLSKNRLEDLQAGARIEINDEKESPLDFALWKKADKNHLMQWDSPWGQGFPGWHIECSAMSQALLPHTDIHTGGEDNVFPHHECEIAQNQCSHGYEIPYWLHAKHLLVDGKKMSKSKGNFFTIRDLQARGWSGAEIRLSLLSAHYRTALNFTEKSLVQARASIQRLQEAHRIFSGIEGSPSEVFIMEYERRYRQALYDDLNVSEALAVVFDLVSTGMQKRATKTLDSAEAAAVTKFLETDFNGIFDVLMTEERGIPEIVATLLEKRGRARQEKNWAESDQLRDEIRSLGFEVLDEADGQQVRTL